MKLRLILVSAMAIASMTSPLYADDDNSSAVTGAAGGAVTGAIVGGPVGAAIGGVAGAIAGTALNPPPSKVVTYVQQQPMPSETVVVKEPVAVGQPLPRKVVLTPIPEDPAYSYAIVNNQRVIVDPQTYTVVQVVQ